MNLNCRTLVGGLLLASLVQGAAQLHITTQPQSQSVSIGANVTFSVTVEGGFEPLSYQWRRNETALAGETNATLTLTNVQLAHAGSYTVVVTDGFEDSVTSDAAMLSVDPTFTRITTGEIVNDGGSSYGCAWGDYDNDGFIDLVVGNGWGHLNFLYRNNGDGTFARITDAPIGEDIGDWDGVAWGDADNDGFLDLFVSGFDPPQDLFYRNNGNGTFTKVTTGPLPTSGGSSLTAAWADYDNDGWLDLFVANSSQQNNFLYHGNADGTFTRVLSGPVVTAGGHSTGCAWGDYDNDGDLDLVVANSHLFNGSPQNDFLFRNDGQGAFTRIDSGPVVADEARGASPVWGDYDNDGDLDLFVSNFIPNDRLYQNVGDGNFELVTNVISADDLISTGSAWGDYDNDGWLDLFVAGLARSPSRLYHNRGDGTFEVLSNTVIAVDGGISAGCAWGDYNNDGFLDLVVANTGPDLDRYEEHNNYLYRNDGNTNRWLMLKLVGSASNRSAIGAKVRLMATIAGKTFWQLREISGGSGYCSQNDMRAHFGLGNATNVDLVRIEWPSGTVQELRNVAMNQILTVTEPPRLQAAGHSSDGAFQFHLTGGIGFRYALQVSSNLTAWTPCRTVTNTNRTILVTEPATPNVGQRFYRAVME